MNLTPENKAIIDRKNHYELLAKIRFAPIGEPWMQGETGEYWLKRRAELQHESPGQAVADSKALGWDR